MSIRTRQLTIFATLFLGYATYNLNRKAVSLVLPELIKSGLEKSDAGMIISSQNIAYAISKFVGGILSDRLSSKLLFSSGLLFSGLATILFALSSDSVVIFSLLWFANGFAQGFGWPSCAKLLRHWFSPDQFGTFWSILSASANISGGASPFVAAFVTYNFGWRITLICFGAFSLLIAFVSLVSIVNCPADIGLAPINPNAAPVQSKEKDAQIDDSRSTNWLDLLKSPFIWLVSFSYMVVFAAKTSTCDWGQMLLIEEHGKSPLVGSSFTSSVETGGFFGGILAGYLTDFILKRAVASAKSKRVSASARLPVATLMMFTTGLALHVLRWNVTADSSQMFITCLGFVLGCSLYGPIAIFGVMASEAAPEHLSGTSHAIVALAANVGAITSGLPFSLFARAHGWGAVFLLLEGITILTVIVMLLGQNIQPNFGSSKKKKKKE